MDERSDASVSYSEEIAWLVGLRLQSVIRREGDWVVEFDGGERVTIECLWRLTEAGRVRYTSRDYGHEFGLPAPVNAADEVTRRLEGALIEAVELREGTLDLEIVFSGGHTLQVIPHSACYEAWNLTRPGTLIIAIGGGDLAIFRD